MDDARRRSVPAPQGRFFTVQLSRNCHEEEKCIVLRLGSRKILIFVK